MPTRAGVMLGISNLLIHLDSLWLFITCEGGYMRKLVIGLYAVALALSVSAVPAFAASTGNTGQPSQSCQAEPNSPAGFNTSGFTKAALLYAGSSQSPTVSNGANGHAVSQYDVACFQVSQPH